MAEFAKSASLERGEKIMDDRERRRLDQTREIIRETRAEAELLRALVSETRQQVDASLQILRQAPLKTEIRPLLKSN
jgi:hypothetical protein